MPSAWIDYLPLWLLFLLTAGLVVLSIEAGRWLAIRRFRSAAKPADGPISAVIGSTVGLLAFLLAFTFGLAAARFDLRRQLLLDEVNSINTCNLRAGIIPEPLRFETRRLLRDYVQTRVELAGQPHRLPQLLPAFLEKSQSQLDALWNQAERVADADRNSEMYALFVTSVHDVIDMHNKRVVVGQYRIPGSIWLALYFVAILSMVSVGYHFGIDASRDFSINLLLAFSFSVVIALIADLDNPSAGNLRVSQQPLLDLNQRLKATAQAGSH